MNRLTAYGALLALAPALIISGGCSAHGSSMATQPSSGMAMRDAQRAPEERPGLGTVFGEERVSLVRQVPFYRDAAAPFAVATLYYNDRDGVTAVATRTS